MLFNSYEFIFLFVPATLAAYYGFLNRGMKRLAIFALVAASLVFYGWWSQKYLLLLTAVILLNFLSGKIMLWMRANGKKGPLALLLAALAVNLGILCYYKYANFFIDNLNALIGMDLQMAAVILPIGISFFTFQEMALLVDIYQGKVKEFDLIDFFLFIMFFPQLIAGPIVHHSEMMPQFQHPKRFSPTAFGYGLCFFAMGLGKKVLLADTAAQFASPQFAAAAAGQHLDFLSAWTGTLAYSAQLYFDFSAYSDMAIGLGQLFGIDLPINFNSPYKAVNIADFWRRWHMTLSRFLRDYLYIPLGGNRRGPWQRYRNLFLTMLLGGIWHGAGWTFVAWGALHGIYLGVNHFWSSLKKRMGLSAGAPSWAGVFLARGVTMLAVMAGWVFFRAADVGTALDVLKSLCGMNGAVVPNAEALTALAVAAAMLGVTWLAPNSQEMLGYAGVPEDPRAAIPPHRWRPTAAWAVYAGLVFAASLTMFTQISEFIYFQF